VPRSSTNGYIIITHIIDNVLTTFGVSIIILNED
jgi:hypothetical protein